MLLTEKRYREVWSLLTVLLCPLPIQFYEVKCRLQTLVNKTKEMFPEREGPGAVTPSSTSSSTKHCSAQKEPQLFISPQEISFWAFFISGAVQPGSTNRQPTHKCWRGRFRRTPANTLEKELNQLSICVPHQRSQLARRHPTAFKIQKYQVIFINFSWF